MRVRNKRTRERQECAREIIVRARNKSVPGKYQWERKIARKKAKTTYKKQRRQYYSFNEVGLRIYVMNFKSGLVFVHCSFKMAEEAVCRLFHICLGCSVGLASSS